MRQLPALAGRKLESGAKNLDTQSVNSNAGPKLHAASVSEAAKVLGGVRCTTPEKEREALEAVLDWEKQMAHKKKGRGKKGKKTGRY